MAYFYGNYVGHWRAYGLYTTTETETSVKITLHGGFQSNAWGYSLSGVPCTITNNGTSKSGTANVSIGSGQSQNVRIVSDNVVTINKGTSAKTITLSVSINRSSASYEAGTSSGSVKITVAALKSYAVTFKGNSNTGGSTAAQTKYYNQALTLRSNGFTRTGHTFSKWNTNSGGTGTNYNAGASYTSNAALTLYAIWTANKYTITYNANGGSGGPGTQQKTYGTNLTISSTVPTKANYTFLGWSKSASATIASYQAGGTFTENITSALTLYAVWKKSYNTPTITDLTVIRYDIDNSQDDDEGTSMRVSFNWTVDSTSSPGDGVISSAVVRYRERTTPLPSYTEVAMTVTGTTEGSASVIIGTSGVDTFPESSLYDVQVEITDNHGMSLVKTTLLSPTIFIMDAAANGLGLAIGKPIAPDATGLQIAWDTTFDNYVHFNNHVYFPNTKLIYGKNPDGDVVSSFEPCNANGGTIIGWGLYNISKGYTNIYGNSVSIQSRGNLNLNGNQRSNKYNAVLWTGSWYMNANQTATLSENVSAQAHGIVLAWSAYVSGSAQNYGWNYTFIPKSHVDGHGGAGVACPMADPDRIGMKYVYVANDHITGNDRNDDEGNVSGTNNVKFSNKYWVLRAVYGV